MKYTITSAKNAVYIGRGERPAYKFIAGNGDGRYTMLEYNNRTGEYDTPQDTRDYPSFYFTFKTETEIANYFTSRNFQVEALREQVAEHNASVKREREFLKKLAMRDAAVKSEIEKENWYTD